MIDTQRCPRCGQKTTLDAIRANHNPCYVKITIECDADDCAWTKYTFIDEMDFTEARLPF